ncbi:hypothetical protein LTR56_004851 [Elasticomyces elasticus]|nr:hypothetical protein LTR56_004851 [Elasticomyces elasticus]KAK3664625.1 hypothetical protein LTR22_004493 [Elasticomyces elasticus]KAK4918407.1 hypothetical protein LTR49_013799 [Elasticomyces elasticus]KAK5760335.1 hypothetical protein LTS12_009549 [Elasticomyces elasticus]
MATAEEDTQVLPASTPERIILAEDGDVILILRGRHFRVSSGVLSLASPVFKTMLGPNFLEGQAPRSAGHPRQITLEDGFSLELLLALMHHFDLDRLRNLDQGLNAETPLDVACVAGAFDKYCCTPPLGMTVEALLRRSAQDAILTEKSPAGRFTIYAYSAASAYLIGSRSVFAEATRCMVLDGLRPFSEITEDMQCNMWDNLPVSVLLGLEEQRTAARNTFISSFGGMTDRGCFKWAAPLVL